MSAVKKPKSKLRIKPKNAPINTGFKFPKGNQFWNLRSKHGREKLFASPALMWAAMCEFFQWCIDNPIIKKEAKSVSNGMGLGSDIEIVDIPVTRPFTLVGLCLYLGCSESYFREFKRNPQKCTPDFLTVIHRAEETIEKQLFEFASVGTFNANLISRKLGLADKSINQNENSNVNYNTNITPEEAKAIAQGLNDKI